MYLSCFYRLLKNRSRLCLSLWFWSVCSLGKCLDSLLTFRPAICAACWISSSLPARLMMDVTALQLNLHSQGPAAWRWSLTGGPRLAGRRRLSSLAAWLWRGGPLGRTCYQRSEVWWSIRLCSCEDSGGWKWFVLEKTQIVNFPGAALISETRTVQSFNPKVFIWGSDQSGTNREAQILFRLISSKSFFKEHVWFLWIDLTLPGAEPEPEPHWGTWVCWSLSVNLCSVKNHKHWRMKRAQTNIVFIMSMNQVWIWSRGHSRTFLQWWDLYRSVNQ